MKKEHASSKGECGKFDRSDAELDVPILNEAELMDEIITEYVCTPPSADELERAERWRNAPDSEHARVLSGLLHLVAGIGRPSVKQDMFPGLLNLSAKYRARYGK
ncbi:MAG: hypothetical protein HY675_26455 [Chloroflexi bacterium]|nr:hypothetical protein [Chloroflexota bacterium]